MSSRGVNKVILIGNLGAAPEIRYTPSGSAVTSVNLATSNSWKNKETGALEERTEWHRLVFFNRLAEIAGQYLKKGSKVFIEGSLRTRKWQDKNGLDRYTTEIVVNEMQMLDSKGSGSAQLDTSIPTPTTSQDTIAAASNMGDTTTNIDTPPADDDIPF